MYSPIERDFGARFIRASPVTARFFHNATVGAAQVYNLSADIAEAHDIAAQLAPEVVEPQAVEPSRRRLAYFIWTVIKMKYTKRRLNDSTAHG